MKPAASTARAENKHLGFTTKEEFIRDATRWRLKFLREDYENVEIPKQKYQRRDAAVKEMSTPHQGASDFIYTQIDEVLEKSDKWLEETEEREKGQHRKKHLS